MGHYEQERELQRDLEQALAQTMPHVVVLDVEFDAPHQAVRVFVDAPEGVTHQLCSDVTLAVRDTCPRYSLEVSSPGLEPPLRHPAHFTTAVGSLLKLRRRGARRPFLARLLAADDRQIEIRRESGTVEHIPYDQIVRCHRLDEAVDDTIRADLQSTSARRGQ